MTTPRVSVMMTAYNRQDFIASAIESVLAQTFDDFELVVVDDGSRDGTVEIARAFERQDPRVRVVVNDRNLGDYPNRNRAASLARGSLLKYHDSDDAMYPHCLAVMVGMLTACPSAAFGLTNAVAWPGAPCPMVLTPRMAYQREFFGAGLFMCGPSGALFRADAFRALGRFDDFGAASDYRFWLRACARVNVALLPADLFWYRLHAGQEMQSQAAVQEYARAARATWDALNASDCPLTGDEREQARTVALFRVAKLAARDCRAGRFALASYRMRESGATPSDWLRYLRLPRRDRFAGTPLDGDGEFAIPDWKQVAATESRSTSMSR
jgi:Glycosyl transferase family 2